MDSNKKIPRGAEKGRLKKRKASEDDAAKCAKLTKKILKKTNEQM